MSRRAVFLDRDGVLNATISENSVPHPPAEVEDLAILPGVTEALRLLAARDLLRIVVTNQPDVARGRTSRETVEAIHRHLLAALPLDAILVCYHDDGDGCACRKPRPGLLRDAATVYDVDLSRSFLVGDRWRDVEAGNTAGCTTFLVRRPYSGPCHPAREVRDLPEAAHFIVELVERGDREGLTR